MYAEIPGPADPVQHGRVQAVYDQLLGLAVVHEPVQDVQRKLRFGFQQIFVVFDVDDADAALQDGQQSSLLFGERLEELGGSQVEPLNVLRHDQEQGGDVHAKDLFGDAFVLEAVKHELETRVHGLLLAPVF